MQEVYSAAKADNAEELWAALETTPGFNKNAKNAVVMDYNNNEYRLCFSYYSLCSEWQHCPHHRCVQGITINFGVTHKLFLCFVVQGHHRAVKFLLDHGADFTLRNNV